MIRVVDFESVSSLSVFAFACMVLYSSFPHVHGGRIDTEGAGWHGMRCVLPMSGWLREYMVHLRYIKVKKIGRTRASAARGCANAARHQPAAH